MEITNQFSIKYRPHTWEEVVGQDSVVKALRKRIIDGNYGVKKSETLKKYNTEKNWVTNSDNAAKQVVVFISNWLLKKFPEPENTEEVENEIRRLNKLL